MMITLKIRFFVNDLQQACMSFGNTKSGLAAIGSLVLFLAYPPRSAAQINSTVYEDFTQTILCPYLINPSSTDSSYRFKARFNNINELGLVRNVSRFYLDADKRLGGREEQEGYHFAGIQVTSAKIGDYISRSRLQLRYSWMGRISRRASVSSGISLGFINYAFLTTQGGTGGSDFGPDGSIGVHYLRRSFSVGLAVQQIFRPVLIPVHQSFRLNRLYNLDISKKVDLSPHVDLVSQLVLQAADMDAYSYGINVLASFFDVGLIGVSNYHIRKTSFSLGARDIVLFNSTLLLMFSYSIYHHEITVSDNHIEVYLAIQK